MSVAVDQTVNEPRQRRGAAGALTVCLISEEFPPETGWGGIGTYSWNLARGLADLGHRVHVIARCWGEEHVQHLDGVEVHRLAVPEPSWRWGTSFINTRFSESRQIVLWNRRVRDAIDRIRRDERIDVIESPEYHAQGLLAARRNPDIPMVVRLHTPAFLCRRLNGTPIGGSAWDTRISEHLEYRLARRAVLVTAPSRSMAGEVAGPWSLDASRIVVLGNPVDDDLFCPTDPCGADDRTILFVGRLERRKGVETLAAALPQVLRACPDARLDFVGGDHPSAPGGGSMKEWLLAQMRRAGVPQEAVRFRGHCDRAALPNIYRAASVCVMPSLYESFGYTCVEAMACGCPVVASAAGALAEIVTHEADGLLAPLNDANALAGAIVRLLRDRDLRRRLALRGRQTVAERFSRNAVCARTAELYRSLVHSS